MGQDGARRLAKRWCGFMALLALSACDRAGMRLRLRIAGRRQSRLLGSNWGDLVLPPQEELSSQEAMVLSALNS